MRSWPDPDELLGIPANGLLGRPMSFRDYAGSYQNPEPVDATPPSWRPQDVRPNGTADERLRAVGPGVALMAAGMAPGVGEGIDAFDLGQAIGERDLGKGIGAGIGLALPFVAAGSLKRIASAPISPSGASMQVDVGAPPSMPPAEVSRMARARAMGFNVDEPVYHGTPADFDSFDLTYKAHHRNHPDERAVYVTPDADLASLYADVPSKRASWSGFWPNSTPEGANVIPLVARGRYMDVSDIDYYHSGDVVPALERARAEGYDGVRFRGMKEGGLRGDAASADQIAVFDPKNLRSRFARFDPSKSDSADLMAGLAGAALVGANRRRDR